MINKEKWINSLPNAGLKYNEEINQLDHYRWANTIPKKKTYNSLKKYTLMTIIFVSGLLFVLVVKNETRHLQRTINNLEASINIIEFNLNQAILDNEVITSPDNISRLAKEHLETELGSYKRSQIKNLNNNLEDITEVNKISKKEGSFTKKIKLKVAKKIEKKKTEILKLQELYSQPETIPGEIKTQVARQIDEKKSELKILYNSPEDVFTLKRVGKWSVIQVVKLILGMPVVPGR
tara:strand:- start:820 stop:1527 length:708 start_codon:yes stop_codon:yes gene_type:complete